MIVRRPKGNEIYVLDDDVAVRLALTTILSLGGFRVACFADGLALLVATESQVPVCIMLDLHLPGRSGLDILWDLHRKAYPAPIIVISGQGDIETAVHCIKNGAVDFIEKPFRGSELVARVEDAIQAYAQRQSKASEETAASLHFPGTEPLTRRERELLKLISSGATNKEAALHLGISPRTVEDHRAAIMKKLGAKNSADLVRLVMTARAHSDIRSLGKEPIN